MRFKSIYMYYVYYDVRCVNVDDFVWNGFRFNRLIISLNSNELVVNLRSCLAQTRIWFLVLLILKLFWFFFGMSNFDGRNLSFVKLHRVSAKISCMTSSLTLESLFFFMEKYDLWRVDSVAS